MTVTDADRQEAARIYQRFRDHDYAKWIMDGTNASGNGDSVIQAFARHRQAAEAPLWAEVERLREAVAVSNTAMAEYYRYWTGGETRGSYDGKPEREGLWRAMYKTRAALEPKP